MSNRETIFTTISRLANEHNALNLGQGFPNFDPDPKLIELIQAKASDKIHQYAPMTGDLDLVQKIIELTDFFYQRSISQSNVLITAGATQAIFTTIMALINKGDEVIMFDPAYDCYESPILIKGAKPIRIKLKFPDYTIGWDEIEDQVNDRTKLIILNNPHNPSGSTFSKQDISKLETLMDKNPQIIILSDEVYEYIAFKEHLSLNKYDSLRKRSIIISSFGKTLHLTGWKIGYLIAEQELLKEIANVHQYNVFSVNSLAQKVISEYLDLKEIIKLGCFFNEKKKVFLEGIRKSRFKVLDTGGTYFQLLDYSDVSDLSDDQMALKMIEENGIASIPISGFYGEKTDKKVLRFCFAKDNETLRKAGEILCQI